MSIWRWDRRDNAAPYDDLSGCPGSFVLTGQFIILMPLALLYASEALQAVATFCKDVAQITPSSASAAISRGDIPNNSPYT
jgi:hypothetical protein